LRHAALPQQALVAVGYSMGAIVLSNMVVRAGNYSVLDGAVAISGGLDMREQKDFSRAQRLWQPMLCKQLRQGFLRKSRAAEIVFLEYLATIHSHYICF
jgi:predicted alpha/beta-fold hydrolase